MSDKITSLGFTFDATQVAPSAPMEAVPDGWYSAQITGGEISLNDGGNGRRLNLEWTITEGQFKNRKAFDGFNIIHSNPQAQEIAARDLSAICHATGVFNVADVKQLFNIPHQIKLGTEPERYVDSDNNAVPAGTPGAKKYEARNKFKGAKAGSAPANVATGAPGAAAPAWAAKPGVAAPAAASAPAAAPTTPPWGAQPAAAPAAVAPAAPAASKPANKPKPASKPKPAAAPAVERKFFVGIDAPEFGAAITESKVAEYLAQGMPAATPMCLEGEAEYKTAAAYGIGAAPAAVTPPPAAPVTPPPAPAAAAPAGGQPPWAR